MNVINEIAIGTLQHNVQLELHTYQAVNLWTGRKKEKDTAAIIGMKAAFSVLRMINLSARRNDPYADKYLIDIEERLSQCNLVIQGLKNEISNTLTRVPKDLSFKDSVNNKPAAMPLYINTPIGYHFIYLLNEFDALATNILLAKHIALLGRKEANYLIERGCNTIRSLIVFTCKYRLAGISREDFAQMNARAISAIERFGELPQDILDGTRRSKFAPEIMNQETEEAVIEELGEILNDD